MSTVSTAEETNGGVGKPPAGKARSAWPIYLLAMIVAGLVGGTIGYSFIADSLASLGIPDPGPATSFGLPFFRASMWVLAALSIGSFMFSAFYISPHVPDNDNAKLNQARLTVDGHLAARTGAVSALCVSLIAFVMVPMELSDVSGTPLAQMLNLAAIVTAIDQVAAAKVWLITAVIALVVGIAGLFFNTWASQPALFVGAVLIIVPLGMEGHAATGGSHDYGTNAYLWHIIFMAIWMGGLFALIAHGRRLGPGLQLAVTRYSSVALFAIIAVALSGVVSMAIRIDLEDLFTSRYGWVMTGKIVGTVLLGLLGYLHRAQTIPRLGKDPRAFIRLAIGEVVLMAAVAGLAVTMGRTPPPAPDDPNLSTMEIQMGYNLYEEPTFFNVWTMWRFDILWSAIALVLAGFYAYGLWRIKKAGKSYPVKHSVYWFIGCLSLILVTSSGIGINMPASYSMHMTGHMLLSMVVPLVLALGAPLTLLMTAWDSGKPGEPNIHDWARAFTQSKVVGFITRPYVNLLQFMFFFYILYLSFPLYELAISEHAGHVIMNTAFLVSGYFYFWELVGPDHLPNRESPQIRLFWLVLSMPVHLFFGVYLMQLNSVMGEAFYQSLQLPWDPDLLADQKVGGGIAWAFGSFPLTFVMILLFLEWRNDDSTKEKQRQSRQEAAAKRREERMNQQEEPVEEDIDELEAYNRMLAAYNEHDNALLDDYYGRTFDDK